MGLRAQVAGPGMQDTNHTALAPAQPRVVGELLQSGRSTAKERRVQDVLVAPCQFPEPIGHGTGDQKVGDGQEALPLGIEPLVRSIVLACGTMPIFAGMITVLGLLAVFTGIHMATEDCSAAGFDSCHGLPMAGGQTVTKCGAILWAIQAEDVGDLDHHSASRRLLMAAVAMASALAVRWV